MQCILLDPYANAFNENGDGQCWDHDKTDMKPELWERKYEIDSLCYPVQLSYLLWKNTGCTEQFTGEWLEAAKTVIRVFRTEQDHENASPYTFERENCSFTDTLSRDGKGALVKSNVGLIWSGFRPSDDACVYGYLIPSNMLASVILGNIAEIAREIYHDEKLAEEADAVRYAGTDQLLFMNGCDHQPVQTDLSAAIRTANALYPDVDFVHSDFTSYVELELETDRIYFSEAPLAEVIARMHEKKLPEYRVLDKDGREIPAVVTEIANHFNYDLPKDKFRQPYIAKRVKITMEAADVPAFGWDTYVLAEAEDNACRAVICVKHTMMLPDAADKTLSGEIEDLVEFKYRKTSRGSHLVPFEIVTEYTLEKNGKGLKVKQRMKSC